MGIKLYRIINSVNTKTYIIHANNRDRLKPLTLSHFADLPFTYASLSLMADFTHAIGFKDIIKVSI